MFSRIFRLLTMPVYFDPQTRSGQMPDYLTLRELADLPSWHPCTDGDPAGKGRNENREWFRD